MKLRQQLPRAIALAAMVIAPLGSCAKRDAESRAEAKPPESDGSEESDTPPSPRWDPAREFATIELQEPKQRSLKLAKFYRRWGSTPGEGSAAVMHAVAHGESLSGHCLREAFAGWLKYDAVEAREWLLNMDPGRNRTRFARGMSEALPNPAARAVLADEFSDDTTRRLLLSRALVEWGRTEPESALQWLSAGRERETSPQELGALVRTWVDQDSRAASESIGGMDDGPLRDEAVASMVVMITGEQPEAARQWAATIADTERRERVLDIIEKSAGGGGLTPPVAGGVPEP